VLKFAGTQLDIKGANVIVVGNAKEFLAELQKKFSSVEVIPIAELDLNRGSLRKVNSPAAKTKAP
jgi:hypothetical protein